MYIADITELCIGWFDVQIVHDLIKKKNTFERMFFLFIFVRQHHLQSFRQRIKA